MKRNLDVTQNLRGLPTAWATAREIRARILKGTGLTASAGISYNKFLAKLASGHRKPNGQFAVTPGMGAAWVEALPVARFHGVGPVTARRMQALGIETGGDLRARSMAFLQEHFGKAAGWHYAIARGEDDRPVDPDRTRKSSGSETTFDRDLADGGGECGRSGVCCSRGTLTIRRAGNPDLPLRDAHVPAHHGAKRAGSEKQRHHLSWLSLLPLRLNPMSAGRRSRADWHVTQVRTPGIAMRRPSGMSSPHSTQCASPSPVGMRARALITSSATVSSI